ncbi:MULTISPECIES: hypothetical protein [unclassified Enterococcus]|uniref:hypothetical protein n=1 Tax=unclassified Enterococcus TaxID=2608891 RepID=UPI0013EC96AE|nr:MULTISPECIES: hypothetical protein [unclassified Enterococcus]
MNEHDKLESTEKEATTIEETSVPDTMDQSDEEQSHPLYSEEVMEEEPAEYTETLTEETKIHQKETIVPQNKEDFDNQKNHELVENQAYLDGKERDHQDIVSLIHTAEAELADLRLRKYLIESDFNELLEAYDRYLLEGEPISPIGKTSLVEYFTYELLKPLNDIGLELSSTTYDTWETRHFSINYAMNEQNELLLSFVLPTIDQRYQVDSMTLLKISPEKMEIDVQDDRVLALIRYWSVDRVFSAGQITIFNHKLNQLLNHARKLGFVVNQTLLDNTKPLRLNLQSEFELTDQVLDDIFIVAMKNPNYDMEKIEEDNYQVLLDKGQSLTISKSENNQTVLSVSSGDYHRSVIDFFINYEFLVPLMVRKS